MAPRHWERWLLIPYHLTAYASGMVIEVLLATQGGEATQSLLTSIEFRSTLVGAFAGAGVAMLLQAIYEAWKTRESKHNAMVCAQLVLGLQLHDLLDLSEQYLKGHRDSPQREREVAGIGKVFTTERVRFAELSFLATTASAEVLSELAVAEGCFLAAQRVVALRNDIWMASEAELRVVHRGIHGEPDRSKFTTEGVALLRTLKVQTDSLYSNVDDAIERLKAAMRVLERAARDQFPEKGFVTFTLNEPGATANPRITRMS